MPKKRKQSFLLIFWRIVIQNMWYLLIAVIPAFISIYQFFGGDKYMLANVPSWAWFTITLVLLVLIFSIGAIKYGKEIENESRKRRKRATGKTVQSKAQSGGQSVAVGRDNFGPIIQGIDTKQIRPDLAKLTEIRERGYLLRNRGMQLPAGNSVHQWIQAFDSWDTEMLEALGEIDRDKAKMLRVLGNIPRGTIMYPRIFSDEHFIKLDVFTEKLVRLDRIIEDYLKVPIRIHPITQAPVPLQLPSPDSELLSRFSFHLDERMKGKKLTGVGIGFLNRIKSAPPFMGLSLPRPVISSGDEKILTDFFRAQVYMERYRDWIVGGKYRIIRGDNRQSVALKVYGNKKYEYLVADRATYPVGGIISLPLLNHEREEDSTEFIERQTIRSGEIERIEALLRAYNLPEDEAVLLMRCVYDAAERTLDEKRK